MKNSSRTACRISLPSTAASAATNVRPPTMPNLAAPKREVLVSVKRAESLQGMVPIIISFLM